MRTKNKKNGKQKTSTESCDKPLQLVLDLIGPFVAHLYKGKARIHAALCEGHHANILTDSQDVFLSGLNGPAKDKGYVYAFKDEKSPTAGKLRYHNPREVIIAPFEMNPCNHGDCHLTFQIPYPDKVVGLLAEAIWMHRNGAEPWVVEDPKDDKSDDGGTKNFINQPRARGLRFIYSTCEKKPQIRFLEWPGSVKPPDPIPTIDALTLGFEPAHYHITLRYASVSSTPDEHHEDAYNCFQSMRALIPGACKWRVDFDDTEVGTYTDNKTGSKPVDCGAAVVVVDEFFGRELR
jgi:hypothetical protein